MDIPIGSKWVRVSITIPESYGRFIGQEVVVVSCPVKYHWGNKYIWIQREDRNGDISAPLWISETEFLYKFRQIEFNLENK